MFKLTPILTKAGWKQAQALFEKILGQKGGGIPEALDALKVVDSIDWKTIAKSDGAPDIPMLKYPDVCALANEVNRALVNVVNGEVAVRQLLAAIGAYLPAFQSSKAEGAKVVASYLAGMKKAASDLQKFLQDAYKTAPVPVVKELERRRPLAAFGLSDGLANAAWRKEFYVHARKESSAENLDFYFAMDGGLTKSIFDKFVKGDIVNLSGACKRALDAAVKNKDPKGTAWAAARGETIMNMTDTFTRFVT